MKGRIPTRSALMVFQIAKVLQKNKYYEPWIVLLQKSESRRGFGKHGHSTKKDRQ
jgi:hypothetical protein